MKLALSFSLLACLGLATGTPIASGAEFAEKEFDYLVVGGGLAGLVVANRLSENPNVRVGVIEAGRYFENDTLINTPTAARNRFLQMNATYDWRLSSAPQKHLNDRVVPLPRGKALGGSSAISLLIFNRGPKIDYDAWEHLGNSGWNWQGEYFLNGAPHKGLISAIGLLPFMQKAERFETVEPIRASVEKGGIPESLGRSGLVAGSYNTWYSDPSFPYRAASIKLGIPPNYDPDSGTNYGIQNSATSTNRTIGRRSYAANTYYRSAANRPNLVVVTEAQATKIELEHTGEGATARGVSFVYHNKTYTAKAKKEVILSAGSFLTPQLLELSGIGSSQVLNKYGITPKVELSGVGENYQDHVLVSATYELKKGLVTYDNLNYNATFAAQAQAQYESTHDGPLTGSNSLLSYVDLYTLAGSAKIAYMHRKLWEEVGEEKPTPLQEAQYKIQELWLRKKIGNVEIILNPGYFGSGIPKNDTSYISVVMCIQHPFSRGNIHLNSSDPLSPPKIDPNYLSKSIDQDILVESIKFADKIAKTDPLASMLVTRQDPSPEIKSDDDITKWVKDNVRTLHHPIGTAAMAPKSLGGVVDEKLKVYGTTNLRVVDASIIPMHIATHLQRTIYGIAEKAAEMIKEDSH
ncbi:choline dehydrogenase [Rhizoctonia solani AG-3 Rhs1AP]|uniref:Choline dehydrogenase n=1 Tax=Rhizoctonia solani AG-3 Rhs1AP TaxID=1086054 RepID=X8J441_9AGAM|nr:choline dehydrogenase [Rhizoctonia solani AG-3 Rhs1AP]